MRAGFEQLAFDLTFDARRDPAPLQRHEHSRRAYVPHETTALDAADDEVADID
jgi:hypothetical protein